jgi:Flp pilus assembly protein TadG
MAIKDMRSKIRSGHSLRRGQSAIEFTLVVPVLLMIMTGLVSFGFALHNFLVLTNGVNNGAQLLAISRGQTTDPCATAYSAVRNAAPGLSSGLSLTFVINGPTYSSTTSCPAGGSGYGAGRLCPGFGKLSLQSRDLRNE